MLDKSKSSVQDTKSTRNRTSVFTTELNKRVHESKQCTYSVSVYPYPWGGGGTPLYGLYRYVPRDREWFLEVLDP